MTREKPGAPHRRIIVDLSFPVAKSVNAGVNKDIYLNTPYQLTLPTIDVITNQVKKLGRGCYLYKVDISRAFRHVKLDPTDCDLLGLRHAGYYVDTCLRFGFQHGSTLFQHLSDAVHHMMCQHNFDVINYIDDIIGVDVESKTLESFTTLKNLLQALGFQLSEKKIITPTRKMNCLGIVVDTETFTTSIPPQKLQEIFNLCAAWQNKKTCSKRELQSLLGSLLYVSKCVKISRFFLNRMLEFLRSITNKRQTTIPLEFPQDLNWFLQFLKDFNGTTFFDNKSYDASVELDACPTGLGSRWGDVVYTVPIQASDAMLNIAHTEMLNILVALRLWRNQWFNKKIQICCDHQASVEVLNLGRT